MTKLDYDQVDDLLLYLQEISAEEPAKLLYEYITCGCEFFADFDELAAPMIVVKQREALATIQFPFESKKLYVIAQILKQPRPHKEVEGFAIIVECKLNREYVIHFRDTQGSAVAGLWSFRLDPMHGIQNSRIVYMHMRRNIETTNLLKVDEGSLYLEPMERTIVHDGKEAKRLDDYKAMLRLKTALEETCCKILAAE